MMSIHVYGSIHFFGSTSYNIPSHIKNTQPHAENTRCKNRSLFMAPCVMLYVCIHKHNKECTF